MNIRASIFLSLAIAGACGKGGGGAQTNAWISGPAPALFGPLASLDPSMTATQARAKDPVLMKRGHMPDPDHANVVFYASEGADDRLLLRVTMPKKDARASIDAAWGKPVDGVEDGQPVAIWLDPKTHVRAILSDDTTDAVALSFDAYVPAETLLAGYAQHPALAGAPELGSAGAGGDTTLPATEYASSPTPLILERDGHGALATEWIELDPDLRPQAKDELLALMKRRWGEPRASTFRGSAALVFGGGASHAIVADRSTGWVVFLTREPIS